MVDRGTHTVSPYLYTRNAAKLIEFLKRAFNAEQGYREDRPDGTVMHAELTIGNSLLELSDVDAGSVLPVMLHHYVADADAVYQRAIKAGATSIEEPVDQNYGDREAGIEDPSGNYWWIATHKENGPIPEGLASITVCLNPRGAKRLIDFLRQAFDATERMKMETGDGSVGHAKLQIGNSTVEISDAREPWAPRPCSVRIFVDDVDAVYARALAAGAASIEAPGDKPYGERNAGVKDPLGNTWYIATLLR